MANSQTFALDVAKWCQSVPQQAELVLRKVCLDMFTRVVMRSPVDTGRFRGNWNATVGTPFAGYRENVRDKSGAQAIAKITRVTMQVKIGHRVFLVNNLPYALRLEYGHSQQAPAGMVRVTVAEFQTVVNRAAQANRQGGLP